MGDESMASRSFFFLSPTKTGELPMILESATATAYSGSGSSDEMNSPPAAWRIVCVEVKLRVMIASSFSKSGFGTGVRFKIRKVIFRSNLIDRFDLSLRRAGKMLRSGATTPLRIFPFRSRIGSTSRLAGNSNRDDFCSRRSAKSLAARLIFLSLSAKFDKHFRQHGIP